MVGAMGLLVVAEMVVPMVGSTVDRRFLPRMGFPMAEAWHGPPESLVWPVTAPSLFVGRGAARWSSSVLGVLGAEEACLRQQMQWCWRVWPDCARAEGVPDSGVLLSEKWVVVSELLSTGFHPGPASIRLPLLSSSFDGQLPITPHYPGR